MKCPREINAFFGARADVSGILCRQSSHRVGCSAKNCLRVGSTSVLVTGRAPSLEGFVLHVIGMAPEEEVVRSHAARVVAAVQDLPVDRDFTGVLSVGKAMDTLPFVVGAAPDHSVAELGVLVPGPEPASVRLLDGSPETVYDWYSLASLVHDSLV